MSQPSRNDVGGDGALDTEAAERLLQHGELTVEGRLVQATNATLYCAVEYEGVRANCVYKPVSGERPLWDFPDGTLAGREVAAYLVSEQMGWNTVPPTVHRDGPFGPGMVQLWIEHDTEVDLLALSRGDDPAIRRMSVFDAVVNNADRKIGHLLPTTTGHVYGCDHGVCFSDEYKLRTVLWQWRGKNLTPEAVETLQKLRRAFRSGFGARLSGLLGQGEIEATSDRVELMLKHRIHPYPPEDWPAIPWPPL